MGDDLRGTKEARWNPSLDGTLRVPKLNFECTDYKNMIDFDELSNAIPPLLIDMEFQDDDISFLASKRVIDHEIQDTSIDLKNLPSHNQSVERSVKLVTEALAAVCGEQARDGWIANTLASRNTMKSFESKSQFCVSTEIQNKLKL